LGYVSRSRDIVLELIASTVQDFSAGWGFSGRCRRQRMVRISNGYTWRGQRTEWWPNSGCVKQTRCRGKDLQPQIPHRKPGVSPLHQDRNQIKPRNSDQRSGLMDPSTTPRTERILGPARPQHKGAEMGKSLVVFCLVAAEERSEMKHSQKKV